MEYSVNSYRKVAVKQRFSDLKKITEETTKYVSDANLQVTDDFKLACNEVMAILANTKPEVKEEVPNNMFLFLAANEDVHYKNEIDHDKDIDSQNLSEKAIYLISIIYRSYLCPDKQALDEILMKNEKKKKRKKKEDQFDYQEENDEESFKFSSDSSMDDYEELREEYLNGLENFDSLDDFLDDEYQFNKFLDEREKDYEKKLCIQEKLNNKKLDRKTRKRARKEMEMFENRLETKDFKEEKRKRKENSLLYKLSHRTKTNKIHVEPQKLLDTGKEEDEE